MKKGTAIGITLSVICILLLLGLGIYLMIDLKSTPAQSPLPSEETNLLSGLEDTSPLGNTPGQSALPSDSNSENSSLLEHHLIFVGDSRTVGMGKAEENTGDACTYIGEVGEGYTWFVENGLLQMEETMKVHPESPVVLNLGVNDLDMIDHYLELYAGLPERYPNHHFYFMSVNPVTEKSAHVTNTDISEFNAKLYAAFPDQYLDCNTSLINNGFESVDGVHYSEDTYREIHDFAAKQLFS